MKIPSDQVAEKRLDLHPFDCVLTILSPPGTPIPEGMMGRPIL